MRTRHHHLKHNALALAAAAALGPLAVLPASAATCTWNTTGGNWATLANWLACVTGGGSPAGTPGGADTANIGATGVVTINTGQSIGTLNNAGQINIDAFGLNLAGGGSTVNSGIINVGGASTANLGISAGHNLNNTGGVINVAAGSVVNQFGSRITGGTIDTTGTGALTVFSSAANFLDGVTLNGGMDMASNAASRQRISNGLTLGSSAIVDLNNNGILSFEGTSTLGGSGSIVLGTTAGNRIDLDGTGTTTFAAGVTVRGHSGVIGQQINIGGTQVLQNNGTIQADVAGGTITITDSNVINSGTLAALNGGTLVLSSNVTGAGGQIVAGVGSSVRQSGVTLSGAINTSGSGLFTAISSAANFLSGVTLNGNLDMASIAASRERVTTGGLVLNGTININQNGILSFEGDGSLTGSGTIVLGATGAGNRIDFDGTGTTTFAAGTLVRGENGVIGQQINIGGTQVLQNNGTIQADVAGGTITITDSNVINSGTLAALNGGTLVLSSNVTGAGGQIVAGVGSSVRQSGVTLSGAINTSGSGLFTAISSAANFLSGVTLNGNLDMASIAASRERVTTGGLVLNGTININQNGILSFEGDSSLTGSGTIVLGATGAGNRIDFDGTGTTTFAAGTLVRGENGVIGQQINIGGTQVLQNNGTIQADVAGGTITITDSNVINSGTLAALNGGTLVLNSDVTGTATGQILAGAGSTVVQSAVTLQGIINTTGGGLFSVISSSANRLTGVTFNGNMDMASLAASRQRVSAGGMELNGTINIDNNGILGFENNGTFSGGANIVFGAAGAGNRIDLDGTGTTTFASGVTVRGHSGTIGQQLNIGGTQTLVNNGLISADTSGGTITITESDLTNNNRIEARNGGTLVLSSDVTNGASGVILADNGVVRQSGVRITGGTIASANGGSLRVTSTSANYLDNVTVTGVVDMATLGASRQRVNNGLTLSGGTINIDNSGILGIEGTSTIGGTGSIVLGSAGAGNRIDLEGTGSTTIASGVTVRGHSGTIGQQLNIGGTQTLVNNGTFNADVGGGTFTFTESALTNNGLVRAQAGTVNIGVALSGNGVLQIDATGVMNLANGAKSQGQLVMGATGAAINLGIGNLTISNDYTNVGAGTGNSFNRRAGVTGTGQIVAGGDVAQVISGTGVTNGATTNATLTIGSVRVGANTFNYEVGNAGTTGPTLRGALQTSVNGGNITDARLSGGGVTAGLYNAGAPGGSSGPQSVVFTASSAGLLAPLTSQALNLRSNFENIADQKLNIVLAGGAAAYNAAVGSTAPSPAVVANQRVGGSGSTALTVSNTAAAGAFSEDLRATFGANGGAASNNGGVVNALIAGSSDSSAMRVAVDASSAGAKTGSVTLNYQTTGTVAGVSNGLGIAGANPPQVITVNGNVYQAASGALQTAPMNFGTIQVGQVRTQDLVVRNTAGGAASFVEDLHAGFGASGNSQITGSGTLTGILAGTDSTGANGLMTVTVNATTVGALNSSIAVNYTSAGAVAGVSNGLGTLAVGSQDYGVSGIIEAVGTVINQANPLVNTPTINLGAVRVGAASPTGAVSVTNVATAPPQAALNASIAPTSGPITAAGSFSLLDPGSTNASSLVVGLNTGTAGNFTGAAAGKATISFVSDASNVGGCAPSCTLDLASQVVNVEGKVYTQAVGALVAGAVNFGVVRVGDTVAARDITINNAAAVTALNDTLRADLGGVSGPFGHAGSVAGIAAGGSGALSVGLNTTSAGIFSQTGTMGFTSQNADLADVSAGADASVLLFAQVNNLANGDFDLLSGSGLLTQSGSDYVLDLGTLVLGSSVSSLLQMDNDVGGPADELSGLFDLAAADDFGYGGWNPLSLLAAGDAGAAMSVSWMAGALGSYSDTIVFNGLGTNASDSSGLAQTRRLTIRATVVGTVPVPGTLSLLLAAAAAGWVSRRRVAALQSAASGAPR